MEAMREGEGMHFLENPDFHVRRQGEGMRFLRKSPQPLMHAIGGAKGTCCMRRGQQLPRKLQVTVKAGGIRGPSEALTRKKPSSTKSSLVQYLKIWRGTLQNDGVQRGQHSPWKLRMRVKALEASGLLVLEHFPQTRWAWQATSAVAPGSGQPCDLIEPAATATATATTSAHSQATSTGHFAVDSPLLAPVRSPGLSNF